jgi:hypothetical protein
MGESQGLIKSSYSTGQHTCPALPHDAPAGYPFTPPGAVATVAHGRRRSHRLEVHALPLPLSLARCDTRVSAPINLHIAAPAKFETELFAGKLTSAILRHYTLSISSQIFQVLLYVPRVGRVRQRIFRHGVEEILTRCFSRATTQLSSSSGTRWSRVPWCREPTERELQSTPREGWWRRSHGQAMGLVVSQGAQLEVLKQLCGQGIRVATV